MKKRFNLLFLIICFIAAYLTAFLGSIFVSSSVNSAWYQSIKPSLTPPNFVFPIVWNILFFLIAIAFYFSIRNSRNEKIRNINLIAFSLNLFLNFFWSFLYFGIKNPGYAFAELFLLWLTILYLIIINWKNSR